VRLKAAWRATWLEEDFSELLSNVMTRYQNRSSETAQGIQELIAMAKKFPKAAAVENNSA
jgi:hypothetical protein